jgi:hypothetical protein
MLGRMFVLRVIAAADVAALHTKPQMDPFVARLQAVLAAVRAWGDVFDGVEMRASFGHGVEVVISRESETLWEWCSCGGHQVTHDVLPRATNPLRAKAHLPLRRGRITA